MDKFEINSSVSYVIDTTGVSLLNNETGKSYFLEYPEAAVWLVFAEGHNSKKALQMLESILDRPAKEIGSMVKQNFNFWHNEFIINRNG